MKKEVINGYNAIYVRLRGGRKNWYQAEAIKEKGKASKVSWGSYGAVSLAEAEYYAKMILEAVKEAKKNK